MITIDRLKKKNDIKLFEKITIENYPDVDISEIKYVMSILNDLETYKICKYFVVIGYGCISGKNTLCNINIKKSFQGKGYGEKLIKYLINKIEGNVFLNTIKPDYYRRFGFEIIFDSGIEWEHRYKMELNFR
jgi:GNAT superfamily N-acetyltransferase